jgi:hypothetical protein
MGDDKEKKIHVLGIRNKRQIIVISSSSTNGNLLPLQIIFTGSTIRCFPLRSVGKVYCLTTSFHLMYSTNYCSTLERCEQFVERILIFT